MRIKLSCMTCGMEELEAARLIDPSIASISVSPLESTSFELKEEGLYVLECEKGHITYTQLQEQKFQVLFELGAYAIADGYYRDAVASFTASLERFYEFFIKANLYEKKFNDKQISEFWKQISNSSIKQAGSFSHAYFHTFGENPPQLSNRKTEFRNEVIHKGIIPTRQQAIDYGEVIIDLISPTLQKVQETMPDGVWQTIRAHLAKTVLANLDKNIITRGTPMLLSLTHADKTTRPNLLGAIATYTDRNK